jgi:hypothetical protein
MGRETFKKTCYHLKLSSSIGSRNELNMYLSSWYMVRLSWKAKTSLERGVEKIVRWQCSNDLRWVPAITIGCGNRLNTYLNSKVHGLIYTKGKNSTRERGGVVLEVVVSGSPKKGPGLLHVLYIVITMRICYVTYITNSALFSW